MFNLVFLLVIDRTEIEHHRANQIILQNASIQHFNYYLHLLGIIWFLKVERYWFMSNFIILRKLIRIKKKEEGGRITYQMFEIKKYVLTPVHFGVRLDWNVVSH